MSPALITKSNAAVISRNSNPKEIGSSSSYLASIQPRTKVEHYWAARALKAETLLSARMTHHEELLNLRSIEIKRMTEQVDAVGAKNAKMVEKFVLAFIVSLLLSFTLTVYFLAHLSYCNRPSSSLPSHFTIPILSPFTSVTEHESSVVGARLIAILLVVLGALAYAIFRHRTTASALIMRR